MEQFLINDHPSAKECLAELSDSTTVITNVDKQNRLIRTTSYEFEIDKKYSDIFESFFSQKSLKYDPIIFGKDQTENIVSVSVEDTKVFIYKEYNGVISCEVRKSNPWIIYPVKPPGQSIKLSGNQFYTYLKEYPNDEVFNKSKGYCYGRKMDFYTISDPVEAFMVKNGTTFFKGMKFEQVSKLAFDIETTGLHPNAKDAQTLLISNYYINSSGKKELKLFSLDEFSDESTMIIEWSNWVRLLDPSIILGHNIYMFDLPYLNRRLEILVGHGLNLGRDKSAVKFASRPSKKRKDGSQEYEYHKVRIHGREVIDTWFLAINYDNVRKQYSSLGLKQIIQWEYENALSLGDKATAIQSELIQDQKNRTFVDAAMIKHEWKDLEKREKIKLYCIDDAKESMYLLHLMAPPYFYLSQSVPKSFQSMTETATGSQINSVMCRNYLQEMHSLPKATESEKFEGAISFGLPGLYKNCLKIDFSSLYPSIMRQYCVCDEKKDPKKYFPKMVEYFTIERLKNKKLAKETGEQYYLDTSESQKIYINSCYGFLGSSGLLFNSPKNAAFITEKGRELLNVITKHFTNKTVFEWQNQLKKDGDTDETAMDE